MATLELIVQPAQHGLPAGNAKSLELLLYAQATSFNHTVIASKYPYHPLTGKLPCVRWDTKCMNANDGLKYIAGEINDLDYQLSPSQKSESFAFRTTLECFQHLVEDYVNWIAATETNGYSSQAPFPLNHGLYYLERRRVVAALREANADDDEKILKVARSLYSPLSDRLGDAAYFFSAGLTSLDCAVAAHIATIVHTPGANAVKTLLVSSFPRLVAHAQNVLSHVVPSYVPAEPSLCAQAGSEAKGKDAEIGSRTKYPEPRPRFQWSDAVEAKSAAAQPATPDAQSASEKARQRNKVFVLGVATSVLAFIVYTRAKANAAAAAKSSN